MPLTTRSTRSRRWLAVAAVPILALTACRTADSSVQASTSTTGGGATTTSAGAGPGTTKAKGGGIGGYVMPAATPDYLDVVARQTRAANTGTFSLTIGVDGATNHPSHVPLLDISGRYDKDNNRSDVKLDLSGLVQADPAAAQQQGVDPTLFGSPMEIVQDGDTAYLKIDALTAALGTDGWVKTDASQNASTFSELFDLFKVDDISGFLETLQSSGSVREVGKEDLDRVPVIHYHADIDPSRLDTSKNAGAGKLLSSFEGASQASVEVWVDEQALVRKLTVSADAGALGKDLGASFTDGTAVLTMGLSDLGKPVDVTIPSPDQIIDLSGVDTGGLGLDPSSTATDAPAPSSTTANGDAIGPSTTADGTIRIDN